ncbi:molecular chaperone [Erythrobacter sp. NE805]|uniref:molecular chaperone n=1 Tax=Erythrobacter sp. NE805 TaxID=3389875 RepID=UPI00396B12DF
MLRFPLAAALVAALALPVPAAAELLVAPTRVVLTPETRAAELVLVNKGTETAAFRIGIENRRMNPDGSLEDAPQAQDGELFADDKLRYSPRQLVLEPGARQVVRIMASAPGDLAPGEYRSHLRLMSAPVSAASAAPAAAGQQPADNSLSIELVAIRSITIPVILRVGKLEASVTMDGAALAKDAPEQLTVRLTRAGTRSTYGDLSLTPEGAKEPAWVVRGVAIYTPNTARDVIVPLPPEVRAALAGRQVRIDYTSTDAADPASAGKRLATLTARL